MKTLLFALVLITQPTYSQTTALMFTPVALPGPVVNPIFPFDGANTPEPPPYAGPQDPVSLAELWLGYWLMTPYGVMFVPGTK